MQRSVSFVSKACLLMPFHLTMLNKHLLKQDLKAGEIALDREKGFLFHKTSASHSEAIQRYVKSTTSNHTIGETRSPSTKPDKETAKRNALMKIFPNVHSLGKRLFNKRIIIS